MEIFTKEIALANLRTFRVELTDPMRGVSFREGVLIKGEFGWSEFAPFAHHSIEHATRWLQAALEMAWTELPKPQRMQVAVNAISTSHNPLKALAILDETGCKTLKIKLSGTNIESDFEFLRVIDQARKDITFRIDFNGSLQLETALSYCSKLSEFDVEYVEQPCASLDEIRDLKEQTEVKIAIDENLRLNADSTNPAHVKAITALADYVVIKPIPVGGIKRFLSIAEQVFTEGKKVVVSGSMDTSIGLYETALAQSLLGERSQLVAGAGTGSLLSTDVVAKTIKPHNGAIEVTRLNIDDSKIVDSPNKTELIQKINQAFDFGRQRSWF